MEIKRKTIVEIETRRRVCVSQNTSAVAVCCPFCTTQERMITAEHAAAMLNITRRAIYRFVENGTAHFIERASGEVLLCTASLAALTSHEQFPALPATVEPKES